jgi:hypothetical protein
MITDITRQVAEDYIISQRESFFLRKKVIFLNKTTATSLILRAAIIIYIYMYIEYE